MLKTDPAAFDFGEVLLGSSPDKSIEIKNIETQMAELAVVSEPLEEYVASYDVMHSSLGAGQATTINIKLRDDIPPGEFSTSISIQVRDNPENRISIPIQGNVVEKLSVTGMK